MSYPNTPKEHKHGSKSYGYNAKSARDYNYNEKSSRTNAYQPGKLPPNDQPPPPYEAVPKSYGYSLTPAPAYTSDHIVGGERASQPVPKSQHEPNKVSKSFTQKGEEMRYSRALAKENRLQQETWDRRFPTIMPKIKYGVFQIPDHDFHGNVCLKDDRRTRLKDQIEEWKEQGKTPWKILELREEWRLQEAEIDKKDEGCETFLARSRFE